MAVNLNGIDLSGASLGSAREVQQPRKAGNTSQDVSADSSASQPGEVSITSTAALLSHLGQALSAQPAVDQGRVERISKALEDGSYRVNPASVATGLLQSERSLSTLSRAQI